MRLGLCLIAFLFIFIARPLEAWARPALAQTGITNLSLLSSLEYDQHIWADASAILRLHNAFTESHARAYIFRAEDYIPTKLPETTNDGRLIMGRVVRHSLKTWVESENRNKSALRQSAKTFDTRVSQEMNFVSGANHKVDFRLKAFQDLAALRYHGPVNASFYYYISERAASLEISQNLKGKTFYVSHIENYLGSTDTFGVRWIF